MMPQLLPKHAKSSMRLENGSRVAVIGGGPAGSFFSFFLLQLAERVGIDLQVDVYEPRDFSQPAPQGCNMCAGVISETLVQNLATEGIHLPGGVIQRGISTYILHTDTGSQRIDSVLDEKRIGVVFRGAGPRGNPEASNRSFDGHLLSLAKERGANLVRSRVSSVERLNDHLQVVSRNTGAEAYDLVAVAAGVNTNLLKCFEAGSSPYIQPKTTKTAIREYYLGKDIVDEYLGDALHIFLLDIPRLEFAIIIPKGAYASVCLLGVDIDEKLLQDFLTSPEVRGCFPEGWVWDQPSCQCMPRINVRPAFQPYADRLVFIGDSGATRLYKDGIGAAYRAAKAAANCAIFEGISAEEFKKYYAPFCDRMELDNRYGRMIFWITHLIQHWRFSRKALLNLMAVEQRATGRSQRISAMLWDTFTGSAPYRHIFLRAMHPIFLISILWALANSF